MCCWACPSSPLFLCHCLQHKMSQQQNWHVINSRRRLDMNPFLGDRYSLLTRLQEVSEIYSFLWLHLIFFFNAHQRLLKDCVPQYCFFLIMVSFLIFNLFNIKTPHSYKIETLLHWKQQNALVNTVSSNPLVLIFRHWSERKEIFKGQRSSNIQAMKTIWICAMQEYLITERFLCCCQR